MNNDNDFFPTIFSGEIIKKVKKDFNNISILSLSVGLAMITKKLFKIENKFNFGSVAYIFLENGNVEINNTNLTVNEGSVLILKYDAEYKFYISFIKLYEETSIFLSTKRRTLYSKYIKRCIKKSDFCPQKTLNLSLIGKGSYGNVYKTNFKPNLITAVKFSKLRQEEYDNPYNRSYSSWHEEFYLNNVLKPIISKNICPNFPLLYSTLLCKNCSLELNNEKMKSPCVVNFVELADGTFKDYLSVSRSTDELYSALFQIMVAVHTIQYHIQLMNFDIKKENILYHNIPSGGYWKYTIKGIDYFVPNFGKLFILNDFGISRSMSPKYITYKSDKDDYFRLGMRYAFIENDKFVPIKTKKNHKSQKIVWEDGKITIGTEFRLERQTGKIVPIQMKLSKRYENSNLTKKSSFFNNPEISPPFEFYNDTQDVIRIFTGGKRTTQKGNHKRNKNIPTELVNKLLPYVGKGDSAKSNKFSYDPSQVLASYFIKSFFPIYTKRKENIIESYIISNS